MGTEKIDDIGKTAATPSLERCPNNFKPWILALVVMVIFTLGWAVYEAQQRGGGVGKFFKDRGWTRGRIGAEQTALNAAAPGAAKALQTSYHGIIDDTRPAVISIDAVIPGPNANPGDAVANYTRIGSGVIIDPRGYALSSLHVVEGASSLKATVYGQMGAMDYPVKVVKADKTSDLVLLRLLADGPLPHASLGDSNAVRTGDVVISIGSPFGFEQSVTSGIISSRNRTLNVNGMIYESMIQTDSAINKGSSGGPLLNSKGDVIGINTAIYSTSGTFAGISFAIPINRSLELLAGVLDFQNELPPVAKGQLAAWGKGGKQVGNSFRLSDGTILTPPHNYRGECTDCHPQFLTMGMTPNNAVQGQGPNPVWGQRRYIGPGTGRGQGLGLRRNPGPWCPVAGPNNISLGMTVTDVDPVIANQNNMMRPHGVFITLINPGTPAEAAGLQRGDVIIRIDGRKIVDGADFEKMLATKGGASMDLVILRFGVRRTVKVSMAQGVAAQVMAGTTAVAARQPTSFAWLGADLKALPADKAGVSVVEVEGILAAAGVKAGDIITGVNNAKVTDMGSFIAMATKVKIKKGCLLDVMRAGNPIYIAVK